MAERPSPVVVVDVGVVGVAERGVTGVVTGGGVTVGVVRTTAAGTGPATARAGTAGARTTGAADGSWSTPPVAGSLPGAVATSGVPARWRPVPPSACSGPGDPAV